jgi:hypothetical protein
MFDEKLIVTCHAKERVKERLGISKKLTSKIADKALKHGVKHFNAKGKLKKYMDSLYLNNKKANNITIYNREVYIFKDLILITVLNLPKDLIKIADKIQKNINSNNS